MKPPFARTLFDLLDEQASDRPLAIAAIESDRSVTYAALGLRVRQVATLLRNLGTRRGDMIAVLLDNRIAWLEVCFAASAVGATLAPISTFVKGAELEFLLRDSRARMLVTADRIADQDFVAQLDEILPELAGAVAGAPLYGARLPQLRHIVTLADHPPPGMIDYAAAGDLAPLRDLPPGERASPGDDAMVLYTSGSSSHPKAVRLRHYAIIENGFNIGERQGLVQADRVLVAPPLFWAYGGANALPAAISHGATLVLQRRFEAGEALRLIEQHGCTAIYTLPGMTAALIAHKDFRPERTRSLRTGLTIGSPQDVIAAAEVLGAGEICNIYGASETCGNCCVTDHAMTLEMRAHCQGFPLPGVSLRIVDPQSGAALAADQVGAVEVKGYLMAGYGGASAEQNAAAFTPDGYFRMGDIGKLTDDGRFVFVGRGDEMIKRAGINVSPVEVEAVLLGHPDVAQAGVVGVPDTVRGARIIAFVVPVAGASPAAETLDSYCRSVASRYKVPDRFLICDSLPTTATGKLLRRELRDRALVADEVSQA